MCSLDHAQAEHPHIRGPFHKPKLDKDLVMGRQERIVGGLSSTWWAIHENPVLGSERGTRWSQFGRPTRR